MFIVYLQKNCREEWSFVENNALCGVVWSYPEIENR